VEWISGFQAEDGDAPVFLKEEGFSCHVQPRRRVVTRVLRVYLENANNNEAVISNWRACRRRAAGYGAGTEIHAYSRSRINILTTPKGVMTGRQARRQGPVASWLCGRGW